MNAWGDGEYGFYSYHIAIATILLVLAEFGTPNVFRRELSDPDGLSEVEVFSNMIVFRMLCSIPVAIACLYFSWHYQTWFYLPYLIVAILLIFRLAEYSLEVSFKNEVVSKTKTVVYLCGLVAKLVFVFSGYGLEFIALVTMLEHCVFTIVFMRHSEFIFSRHVLSFPVLKVFISMALVFALSYFVVVLGGRIYTLLIFNILDDVSTGIFSFSTRLVELILVPTQIFASVLLPLLMKVGCKEQFKSIYSDAVCMIFYGYILCTCLFVIIQEPFLKLIIDDYVPISDFVVTYVVLVPFMAMYALSTVFYTAKGALRLILFRSLIFLIASVLSGYLLINLFELQGVVLSVVISYVIVESVSFFFFSESKEELKLRLLHMTKFMAIRGAVLRLYKLKLEP